MKRTITEVETLRTSYCNACSPKRRKTRRTDVGAPRSAASSAASPPPSDPPPQTLTLTTNALKHTPQASRADRASSIQHWVEACPAVGDADMMEAPPTPRSASSRDRGRRSAKRQARTRASRTPSPSKKPSPQTYRTRNMYHANVFVDHLAQLPSAIDAEARRILAIDSWSQVVSAEDDVAVNALASSFCVESRRNARECSLEGDWKNSLYSAVRGVSNLWPSALKTHMTEKLWIADLKPMGSSLDESQYDDLTEATTPRLVPSQPDLPAFDAAAAEETASSFAGSVPSLPPFTQSIAWTTSTEAADPYHISTPKPDITIGLAHTSFSRLHQHRLVDHQASESILSDPHTADMGVRFPFLIVEAKGLSLNGSLVAAQNQAAIAGASMLTILKDLAQQVAWDEIPTPTSIDRLTPPTLCFSIVTEGPIHELSVHFEHEGAVHMESVKSWRTTYERDAIELVCCLTRIIDWGRGRFRERVVGLLDRVLKRRQIT